MFYKCKSFDSHEKGKIEQDITNLLTDDVSNPLRVSSSKIAICDSDGQPFRAVVYYTDDDQPAVLNGTYAWKSTSWFINSKSEDDFEDRFDKFADVLRTGTIIKDDGSRESISDLQIYYSRIALSADSNGAAQLFFYYPERRS